MAIRHVAAEAAAPEHLRPGLERPNDAGRGRNLIGERHGPIPDHGRGRRTERAARENPERQSVDDRAVEALTDVDDPFEEDVTAESVAELGDEHGELSAGVAARHSYSPEEAFDHGLDPDGPQHDGYYEDPAG